MPPPPVIRIFRHQEQAALGQALLLLLLAQRLEAVGESGVLGDLDPVREQFQVSAQQFQGAGFIRETYVGGDADAVVFLTGDGRLGRKTRDNEGGVGRQLVERFETPIGVEQVAGVVERQPSEA